MKPVIATVILVAVALIIVTLLTWQNLVVFDLERNASIQEKEHSAYIAGTLGITCAENYRDSYLYRFCIDGKLDRIIGETKE